MNHTVKNLGFLLMATLISHACGNMSEPKTEEVVYDLLPSSKDKFPYKNEGLVVFTDSLDNSCVFEVSELKSQYLTMFEPVLYTDYKTGEETNYTITTERYGCYLKNDSLDLEFHVVLETEAHKNSIENRRVKDQLSISTVMRKAGSKSSNNKESQVFYFAVNQRNYPGKNYDTPFDKITILNVEYLNVYEPGRHSPDKMKILYNHDFGILTFTDDDDNYWCFKEYIGENGS